MKTFEEKWTAWLDGQLSDRESAEFEASLPNKAAAEAEKAEAKKLGLLLKRELGVEVSPWWTIRRLLWTGAASLAVFLVMAIFVMRDKNPAEQSQYLTQILNARVDPVVSPNATISMFETKEDR